MDDNNKTIDNKTLRYCLYIGLLACLVAVGVGQVQAWYHTRPDQRDLW